MSIKSRYHYMRKFCTQSSLVAYSYSVAEVVTPPMQGSFRAKVQVQMPMDDFCQPEV